ncbi:MAG TPA: choice-of-anchor tandem repeat GloVer-containing protein [Candidatus Binatia bacterium]|nr:choice-of-anchor tandem repeat GloVer-containing protein [Candidatus Binatia bacterium]
MKGFILTVSLASACLNLNAQNEGTVTFGNNSSCKLINAQTGNPVTTADGVRVSMVWSPANSNHFTQIGGTITNVGFPLPGLFVGGTRTTGPATPGGATGQFQLRAWAGGFATYEEAVANGTVPVGQSAILQVPTGNPNPTGGLPTPPGSLFASGLQGFTLSVGSPLVLSCASNKSVQAGPCSGVMTQPGYSLLHVFAVTNNDGQNPLPALIQGNDGALYGTTEYGGSNGVGAVFKVNPDSSGYAVLHHFSTSGNGGQQPEASLLQGKDGMLYGVTANGGGGAGTVFKLNPDGTGLTVLKNFTGANGAAPEAALVQGLDGFLYGVTVLGGSSSAGTIFKLDTNGNNFAVLKSFPGGNEANPEGAALAQGSDGTLYGATGPRSGANGVVFKINPDGTGYAVLKTFTGSDGQEADGRLLLASDNMLYGTTRFGGSNGLGVVFKLSTSGSNFSVLKSFGNLDGTGPESGLIEGCDGALYGTAPGGGTGGGGTVYKLNKDGSGFTVLWNFQTAANGGGPTCELLLSGDGTLYGTASSGGSGGVGTVFKLTGGLGWSFDPPTVADTCCTNVTLTVLNTVTNGSPPSQMVVRTWQATDCCGNSTTCSQTVTLVDNRPPQFSGTPTNLTVAAGQDIFLSLPVTGAQPLSNYLVRSTGKVGAVSSNGTFFLPAILPSDAGQYFLLASNTFGVATSAVFQVQVTAPANVMALLDANNILKIIGTDGNDDVKVMLSPSNNAVLQVVDQGTSNVWAFPTNAISRIMVDLAAGADRVVFSDENGSLLSLREPEVMQDNTRAFDLSIFGPSGPAAWWSGDCPSNIVVTCAGPNGTDVSFPEPDFRWHNLWADSPADRISIIVANIKMISQNVVTATFPLGTTQVKCTAYYLDFWSEDHNHDCTFNVTVLDQTPVLCHPLTNAFSANFNSGSPNGMTLYGNAQAGGGVLKLTQNLNNQLGAAVLDDFNQGNLISAFNASFDLFIGGGTSPSADGFSFNLAADLPATPTLANTSEEGMGTGLTVEFDTFTNGTNDPIGVSLKFGGQQVLQTVAMQTSEGPTGSTFVPVNISLGFDGMVTVSYNGSVIIQVSQNFFVPAPGSRFALAARTGAFNDKHWVKNLSIQAMSARATQVVAANSSSCGAIVAFDPPCFQDLCDAQTPNITFSLPNNTYYPVGTQTVCCVATDPAGTPSLSYCFTVIVQDTTPPVLDCSHVPVIISEKCVDIVPDFRSHAVVTDNCTPANQIVLRQNPAPGSVLAQGVWPITIIACDDAGNCVQCTTPGVFIVAGPSSPLAGFYNTGVDNNGNPLPGGAADSHFTLGTGVANPTVIDTPSWYYNLPDDAVSQWIGLNASGTGAAGDYVYRVTFTVPCNEYLSAAPVVSIGGRWATDSSGTIRVNGAPANPPQNTPAAGYNAWTPFSLTSGFAGAPGPYTIDFDVTALGGSPAYTALRVEFTNAVYRSCTNCLSNPTPPSRMVLWLPFDETDTSGVAQNVVGAVNGTYSGQAGLPSVNNGFVDRSLCFNGVDQAVRVAYYADIDESLGDFTIDAWVNRNPGDIGGGLRQIVDHRIVTKIGTAQGYALYLDNNANGALTCVLSDGVHTALGAGSLTVPADGQWHFVATVIRRASDHQGVLQVDSQTETFTTLPVAGISIANANGLTVGAKNDPPSPPAEGFDGCIDEVEIFNRALLGGELYAIFNAGSRGKLKFTCALSGVAFCGNDATTTVSAGICNRSTEPETFLYGLHGLLPNSGTLSGPLAIGNTPGYVTVNPGQCQTVTFTVQRPPGLTYGKSGAVQLEVFGQNTHQAFSAQSTVYQPLIINCAIPYSGGNGGEGLSVALRSGTGGVAGSFTFGPVMLANPYYTNIVLNYRVRVAGPLGLDDLSVISLGGLPPGTWVSNSVPLAPGATTPVYIQGQFLMNDPGQTYHIWIEANLSGAGGMDPLYDLPVTEVYPAQLEIHPVPVILGTNTVPGTTWPGIFWTGPGVLQTTPSLGGPWTDLPSAPNPYTVNPTNSAMLFRLKQ